MSNQFIAYQIFKCCTDQSTSIFTYLQQPLTKGFFIIKFDILRVVQLCEKWQTSRAQKFSNKHGYVAGTGIKFYQVIILCVCEILD